MRTREMDYTLGNATLWKNKHRINWCEQCERIILIHEGCRGRGTTCNGGGCPNCQDDFVEFNNLKMDPYWHLNDTERAVVEKHSLLRDLIFVCLDAGKTELDWLWLLNEGQLSKQCEEIFESEIFMAKIIAGVD